MEVNVLSTDGRLIDSPTAIAPPDQLTTLAPTVVGLSPDRNLVVYSRLVPGHDYGALRVHFQIVDSSHPPNPDGGQVTDGGADGAGDAPAPRDAAAGAALASSSGCSCAVSATGPAARHDQVAAALLLFLAAACLRRRQRRGGH